MKIYIVEIKGRRVPTSAKNEAQLKYAVQAMTDAAESNPKILDEYEEASHEKES